MRKPFSVFNSTTTTEAYANEDEWRMNRRDSAESLRILRENFSSNPHELPLVPDVPKDVGPALGVEQLG